MSKPIFKILIFLKRRPGMSVEEFRDYYENKHVKLGEKYSVNVSRYIRRYLEPLQTAIGGTPAEPPYDVITELWFEDEALFRGTAERMVSGAIPEDIYEDEKKLFEREKTTFMTAVECESN